MARQRIALIGAGLIGREHARFIAAHPDAELAGIADIGPGAEAFAAEFGAPLFADYRTLLDATRPDGAIVALPNALHLQAGLEVIARGIPLFMEKPVADTIAAARQMVAAAEAAGVPIQVGHHRRHAPDIVRAKKAIADGELGRIMAVNGMWLAKKPLDYFNAQWRREPGGGPLLINLIHDIDLLRHLCGDIETVQAMTANTARGFAVEDTAAVLMRFTSGALGTFTLSDAVPSPYCWDTAACQALYLAHQPGDCFFIGGQNGTLSVPSMDLWRNENDGDWRHPLVRKHLAHDHASCYVRQLDNFLAVTRGEAAPLVTGADATWTLATVEAIALAAAGGKPVTVADVHDGDPA